MRSYVIFVVAVVLLVLTTTLTVFYCLDLLNRTNTLAAEVRFLRAKLREREIADLFNREEEIIPQSQPVVSCPKPVQSTTNVTYTHKCMPSHREGGTPTIMGDRVPITM